MAAGRLHGTQSPLGLGDTGGVLDRVPLMEGGAQGVSLTGLTPPPGHFWGFPRVSGIFQGLRGPAVRSPPPSHGTPRALADSDTA